MTIIPNDLRYAPMFSCFRMESTDRALWVPAYSGIWDLISGLTVDPMVRSEANRRGVRLAWSVTGDMLSPQRVLDAVPDGLENFDNIDASLEYLAAGGMLTKLPDGNDWSRDDAKWDMYVIIRAAEFEVGCAQRIANVFFTELQEGGETFSTDTGQVEIKLAAMTRSDWSATVTVPKSSLNDANVMRDLACRFFDEIDVEEYNDDHEYWEKESPSWDPA